MKSLFPKRYQIGELPVIWITRLPGGKEWVTQCDYQLDLPEWSAPLVIPQGFKFDLASVPRWAWFLIAPFELSIIAPLVHDFFYRYSGRLPNGADVTRKYADDIFYLLMLKEDVPTWKSKLAYRVVRSVSWAFWEN